MIRCEPNRPNQYRLKFVNKLDELTWNFNKVYLRIKRIHTLYKNWFLEGVFDNIAFVFDQLGEHTPSPIIYPSRVSMETLNPNTLAAAWLGPRRHCTRVGNPLGYRSQWWVPKLDRLVSEVRQTTTWQTCITTRLKVTTAVQYRAGNQLSQQLYWKVPSSWLLWEPRYWIYFQNFMKQKHVKNCFYGLKISLTNQRREAMCIEDPDMAGRCDTNVNSEV